MLRGMFEDRIQNVIRELKERPNLILFVDEAHTMVGAGSALGAPSDAANVFKSVLARGEIRMVAATTLSEYKEYIQEDEALARRFRCVTVCEPTIEETRRILYSLRPRLERNYSVRLLDEAIETALEMSPRYMRHLHLPDKVIGWLDTAAVRAEIDRRWEVNERGRRRGDFARGADSRGHGVSRRDRPVQGHRGAPAAAGRRPEATPIDAVAHRLVLNKGPLKDGFDRPDGVLLFLGPDRRRQDRAGEGGRRVPVRRREEDDPRRHVRVPGRSVVGRQADRHAARDRRQRARRRPDESAEGQPVHASSCSTRSRKASPNLLNLFLQAFDEGWLTDGRGKRVYLSDAVVIMTSNIGSEHFRKLTSPMGFLSRSVGVEQVQGEVMRELERRFPPEFRNRIDEVVLFAPLTHDEVREIAKHYLAQVEADARQGRARRIAGRRRGAGADRDARATAWRSARAS